MTTHTRTVWEPTPTDRYAVEDALETLPFVRRACVARVDDRETVVLVAVDGPAAATALRDSTAPTLAAHGIDPASVRVRVVSGWLPGRDAFPAPIRRRCARGRYAHLLVTITGSAIVPLGVPLLAG
jgi:hypothetical protein